MGTVTPKLIVIGASAGGFDAVSRILRGLDPSIGAPVVVVLHLPENFNNDVGRTFNQMSGRAVVEINDKTPIKPREVYFAPPAYHLLLERDGRSFALSQDEKVHFARPSIDVFFKSVAEACGNSGLGVLLTGANEDGAAGLKAIHDRGGLTVVQDPRTAQVPTMPAAALALFAPTSVAGLDSLAAAINDLMLREGTRPDGPKGDRITRDGRPQ